MDPRLAIRPIRAHRALLLVAVAPLVPQILGSAFNVWYNTVIIEPLLQGELKQRFIETVIVYNALVFPAGIAVWLSWVYSFAAPFEQLRRGLPIAPALLTQLRRRLIHLPWFAAAMSVVAWFLCIPVFLISLWQLQSHLPGQLLWHLPISFCISGFISLTHTIFLVELASQRGLFPVFFSGVRADQIPNVTTLSLRGRGILWAVSASLCPIGSLLLLAFAPQTPGTNPQWFAVFVGTVGIAFGLCTAVMISGLVARPIDYLRSAAESVSRGQLDVSVPVSRADEFGMLLGEFNNMIRGLKEKEKLRQTFGLHVGERAAEQILKRDPGLGGVEEEVTVMFVDIRASTAQAAAMKPREVVELFNSFFRVTVQVVEEHGGMVNKFLGDGFMALFGAGGSATNHADAAVTAGHDIVMSLQGLNRELNERGREPIRIGVGLHTGVAVVGSIGSPQRLEFTAIGETVNVASRIERLTKTMGRQMLLTEAVHSRLTNEFPLEPLPPQQIRGIDEPIAVFTWRDEAAGSGN